MVALSGLSDSGFLVTLGDCRHLADLVLVVDHGRCSLGDCCRLRSLAIVRGFVLMPVGDSQSVTLVKSIEVWRGL